jgi:proteasome accessory factor C
MSETAAAQLRRILRAIPEIADGKEHGIEEAAERAGVPPDVLLSDLKSLAERYGAPGGFIEGMQVYIGQQTIEVTSEHFLRPMGLTLEELCALELGLVILRSERPPDETGSIDRARERLRRVIAKVPDGFDETAMRHAELAPTEGLPFLDDLRRALRDHRKVTITYRRSGADAPTTRTVRLYAIVPASGMWYAVAYCEASEGLRVFRMDRVEDVNVRVDRYEVPEDFSVHSTLREGKGLSAELPASGMRIRYSPRVSRWIAEREGVTLDPDESLTMEHPLADEEWGLRHVLQYGEEAEVLEPPALRAKIAQRLSAAIVRLG